MEFDDFSGEEEDSSLKIKIEYMQKAKERLLKYFNRIKKMDCSLTNHELNNLIFDYINDTNLFYVMLRYIELELWKEDKEFNDMILRVLQSEYQKNKNDINYIINCSENTQDIKLNKFEV